MLKEYLKNSWRKLDNTAKIFSLDSKKNTNIFRYSIILKSKVDKDILKKALDKTLNNFQDFKVKLGTGLFWHYLEFNEKEPIITEENEIPCNHFDLSTNNDYLFKVTYYNKKINLDIFHVLTDGTGAIIFLKSLIYNYLNLKYQISYIQDNPNSQIIYQDEYLKHVNKSFNIHEKHQTAFHFQEKIIPNTNNTYHYILDIDTLKKVCKKYQVTITEYILATYTYAIYSSNLYKNSQKEIITIVPISLRKYYQVNTLSNFFVCMNINPKIIEKNLLTFNEVLQEIHQEFQEKLTEEKVPAYLTRDVNLGLNPFLRILPLPLKKLGIKSLGSIITRTTTTTLSNVGAIDIDSRYKKYIDNILILVIPSRFQNIKCTICSYDKKLNITMNSNINDKEFEKEFYKLLKKDVSNIKIETNNFNLKKELLYDISKNKIKKEKHS